jgi:predicted neutral ceramidase superfamily lipid hydrolase
VSGLQSYLTEQNITLRALVLYGFVAILVYMAVSRLLLGQREMKYKKLLVIACLVLFSSLLLPSPLIHGENTNFTTHFVGGGIFTGLIWLFLKLNYRPKLKPLVELASLYLLVSGLGVANELFEFAANALGILNIPGTDTWWDLFANTLGALTFWICYKAWSFRK